MNHPENLGLAGYVSSELAHADWCDQMFTMMNEGGVWGVPRSGLIFTKCEGRLVLTGVLPYSAGEDPDEDFECIRDHFAAAGIDVVRPSE